MFVGHGRFRPAPNLRVPRVFAAVVGVRCLGHPIRTNAWTREEETNWSPPRRYLFSCRALGTTGGAPLKVGRSRLGAGPRRRFRVPPGFDARSGGARGPLPIRFSFFGLSRTAQGMPRRRRLRASIGSGAAVALSNGSAELEPPPVLTMMSLCEGFKSLRDRILPSGAVLSRGRGALFRKADPDLASRMSRSGPSHRHTARAREMSRAFAF